MNQYVTIDTFTPTFDANGNQTLVKTTTGTWTVGYNAENRPITWTQGDTVITMTYDHMGRRITKNTTQGSVSSVEKFVYNGYLCIQTLSNVNAVTQSFVWDPTESIATRPLVFTEGEQTAFYMHDGNKNVTDIISSMSGSSDVTHYDYAPFGAVVRSVSATVSTSNSSPITHHSAQSTANPFRFSSEWHDDDLGLIYYNYRHYNPTDGRWMSRDPIADIIHEREYLFCGNDFVNKIDQRGLSGTPAPGTPEYQEMLNGRQDKCNKNLRDLLTKDGNIKTRYDALEEKCKPDIKCVCCDDPETWQSGGFFQPPKKRFGFLWRIKPPSITLCSNNLMDKDGNVIDGNETFKDVLEHELIHAKQKCGDEEMDNCEESICHEIGAYYHANCAGKADRKDCVKKGVYFSSEDYCPVKPGESRYKRIDEQFDRLYGDGKGACVENSNLPGTNPPRITF